MLLCLWRVASTLPPLARERRWYARHPEARRRLSGRSSALAASRGRQRQDAGGRARRACWRFSAAAHRSVRRAVTRARCRRTESRSSATDAGPADLDHAGDEPLMLARRLPTVPVLVSRIASWPAGSRRPVSIARSTCWTTGSSTFELERERWTSSCCRARTSTIRLRCRPDDCGSRSTRPPRPRRSSCGDADETQCGQGAGGGRRPRPCSPEPEDRTARLDRVGPAGAVVPDGRDARPGGRGLARPERFLRRSRPAAGRVAGRLAFADHHRFTRADVITLPAAARAAQAVTWS